MNKSYLESMPDINGFFGKFGGSFIPPVLEKPFADITKAHAVGFAMKLAKTLPKDKTILVSLSGRGDKDIDFVIENYPIPNSKF